MKTVQTLRIIPLFFIYLILLIPTGYTQSIGPTDVYRNVAQLRGNLEMLRKRMNKPDVKQSEIDVRDVSPREVFTQAGSMLEKSGQLILENNKEKHNTLLLFPKEAIKPAHVYTVTERANTLVAKVVQKLGMTPAAPDRSLSNKTPTDVFKNIIQANRQLNLLLKKRVTPSDVYRRVQAAVNYAQILTQQFGKTALPAKEPLDNTKKPKDVYNRLVACFQLQKKILQMSDIKVMNLGENVVATDATTPGDVYDIASLVYSEVYVAFLSMKKRKLAPGSFYPGIKKPPHVFQLAGQLEKILVNLERKVAQDKDWLSR